MQLQTLGARQPHFDQNKISQRIPLVIVANSFIFFNDIISQVIAKWIHFSVHITLVTDSFLFNGDILRSYERVTETIPGVFPYCDSPLRDPGAPVKEKKTYLSLSSNYAYFLLDRVLIPIYLLVPYYWRNTSNLGARGPA